MECKQEMRLGKGTARDEREAQPLMEESTQETGRYTRAHSSLGYTHVGED